MYANTYYSTVHHHSMCTLGHIHIKSVGLTSTLLKVLMKSSILTRTEDNGTLLAKSSYGGREGHSRCQ